MARTALAVLVPELEPLIGELRRRHTLDGAREMPPHVTLLDPFAPTDEVDACVEGIARALAPFEPFAVSFRAAARWPEVLYLEPDPPAPFVALTEALMEAFPEFPPYGGEFDEIVPHATVAFGDDELLSRLEAEIAPQLGVTAHVERVWLVEDTPAGWRRRSAFPLDRRSRD